MTLVSGETIAIASAAPRLWSRMLGLEPDPLVLLGAMVLDQRFGDPPNRWHPVAWLGRAIGPWAQPPPNGLGRRGWALGRGVTLVVLATAGFVGAGCLVVGVLSPWPALQLVAGVLVLKTTFAIRALGDAGEATRAALRAGDLGAARHSLRSLCSRDPSDLGPSDIAAAAVESVAENASDSGVAPIFYYALFGLPGALAYRAINTLDAMVGYRGRYEQLGKAAARLDDLLNWIPARLCAGLLLTIGGGLGADLRRGWHILRRDGAKTPSPNAGRPMAAMAGLLGIALSKPGVYTLGDPSRPVDADDIARAWQIVRGSMIAAGALACVALLLGGWS